MGSVLFTHLLLDGEVPMNPKKWFHPRFFLGGLSHRDLTIPSDPQIDGYSVVNIDVQTAQFVHHIIEKKTIDFQFLRRSTAGIEYGGYLKWG